MKKFYPKSLLLLLLPFTTLAQLYVRPNPDATSTDEVYIYNKGQILFVEQDINLDDGGPTNNQGNIYLRDEGQVIQGRSNAINRGDGIISVYQEGTANEYDYHFWASPVSDPYTSTADNQIFNLDEETTRGGIYGIVDELRSNIASFPAGQYEGETAPLTIAPYWLQKFTTGTEYANWIAIGSAGDLNPGEGFTMKGVMGSSPLNPQRYDFRGRPNNGDIEVAVAPGEYTLVGNPYPSSMDLNFYLLSNSDQSVASCTDGSFTPSPTRDAITGIAYFWESDPSVKSHYLRDYQGGYGTYSPSLSCSGSGTYVEATYTMYDINDVDGTIDPTGTTYGNGDGGLERRNVPIAQGFFVVGSSTAPTGSKVIARNEFRVFKKESIPTDYSDFKSAERVNDKLNTGKQAQAPLLSPERISYDTTTGDILMPKFKISTGINDTYVRVIATTFFDEGTDGFDRAGDAVNSSILASDVSYLIEDDTQPYVINILPYNIDKKLPLQILGGQAKNKFLMKVSSINFDTDGIWLHDKQTDEFHDILYEAYEFSLPKGQYNDRFEVVFKNESEANLSIAEDIKTSFSVFQNNNEALVHISNPLGADINEISIYDISGKQLAGKLNEGTSQEITISSAQWSDGIYIVRLVTKDNIEFTKKIAVANKK